MWLRVVIVLSLLFPSIFSSSAISPPVLTRVPESGLQPQTVLGSDGTLHLLYFKGDPKAGDLFYTRRSPGGEDFSKPLRVNSKSGAAIAIGTIRGGQLALGKSDRVHVAWNGSGEAARHKGAPMLYARLNDAKSAFELERDIMDSSSNLDGGGSVAADANGNVYVAWHGHPGNAPEDEANRAVFLAISRDDGATFSKEAAINPEPTGACGCCGLKIFATSKGRVYVLYRAAREGTQRDETLISSSDRGLSFQNVSSFPWKATTCPMSSAFLANVSDEDILVGWEKAGRVFLARVIDDKLKLSEPISPSGQNQKYPVAVANRKGETLLVWAKDTGWAKGGSVAWQIYDSNNQPTKAAGTRDGLPMWSLPAAAVRPDGQFEIIY